MSDGEKNCLLQEVHSSELQNAQPEDDGIATIIAQKEEFSGPLPPPSILAQYQEQGVLDNILKLAMDANDRENRTVAIQEKYCQMQQDLIDSEIKTKNAGFIVENVVYVCFFLIVFLFVITMLALFAWYAYKNMFIPAGVSFFIMVVFPKLIKDIYRTKKK